jgi:hypothetical protein
MVGVDRGSIPRVVRNYYCIPSLLGCDACWHFEKTFYVQHFPDLVNTTTSFLLLSKVMTVFVRYTCGVQSFQYSDMELLYFGQELLDCVQTLVYLHMYTWPLFLPKVSFNSQASVLLISFDSQRNLWYSRWLRIPNRDFAWRKMDEVRRKSFSLQKEFMKTNELIGYLFI